MGEKIAAIADVHGNADALRAVLADIDAQGIARIVNLGDHLSGPLDPAGAAALLRGREMLCVRGNHDRRVGGDPRESLGATDGFTWDAVTAQDRAWLRDLPVTLEVDGMFLCHAIPTHDETYWVEQVSAEGAVGLRPREEIEALATGVEAGLLLCGHSHQPRAIRFSDGRLLVNPGSVGCPAYSDEEPVPHAMEVGGPDARYAVLEQVDGIWRAAFRCVPYDASRMVAAARAAGREDWAIAVATGRVA